MKWSLICGGILLCLSQTAQAQGLIWSLPNDGDWIRYEGTYTQVVRRPDSPEGDLTLEFRRVITVKSVGMEDAEYRGQVQPCRWIEIKSETGKPVEGVLETGPGGVRLYKLLVPESAIQGEVYESVRNDGKILNAFIPVVKGFRKIGNEPVQPIGSGVFDLYPLVSLLRHYPDLSEAGPAESIQVPAGTFSSSPFRGQFVMESFSERSTSTGELSRSNDVPFGLTQWTATTVIETKGTTDERTAFKEEMIVTEKMQAAAIGQGAESEVLENN